jgi:hypothetical protein
MVTGYRVAHCVTSLHELTEFAMRQSSAYGNQQCGTVIFAIDGLTGRKSIPSKDRLYCIPERDLGRVTLDTNASRRYGDHKEKGPFARGKRPFVMLSFCSYDNPHTICQNLPETAVTSAEAEEGQREELEACIPAAREGLGMQCVA